MLFWFFTQIPSNESHSYYIIRSMRTCQGLFVRTFKDENLKSYINKRDIVVYKDCYVSKGKYTTCWTKVARITNEEYVDPKESQRLGPKRRCPNQHRSGITRVIGIEGKNMQVEVRSQKARAENAKSIAIRVESHVSRVEPGSIRK